MKTKNVKKPENASALKRALIVDMVITAVISVIITSVLGVLFFTNTLVSIIYGKVKPENIPTSPGWADIVMVLLISILLSATVAFFLIRRTFRKNGVYIDGEFWVSFKTSRSRFRLNENMDFNPDLSAGPMQTIPPPPIDNSALDTLTQKNRQLLSQNLQLQAEMELERQFNTLMLSLLDTDNLDSAEQQQDFLRLFSTHFQADYSALYIANAQFSNYPKQLHWDKDPETARHSTKVENLNPGNYPWAFKQITRGKPFIFRAAMLDGLLSQFDGAADDAKSWLQMKMEDTAEYLLCKHEAWEHLVILPCMKDDNVQAILMFGYSPVNIPIQSDFIERMQPAASAVLRALLRTPVTATVSQEGTDLQSALQNLNYGVILTDTDGLIRLGNPAAQKLLRTTQANIGGLAFDQAFLFVDPATQMPLKDFFRTLTSGSLTTAAENIFQLQTTAGYDIKVELDVVPVHDSQDNPTGNFILMKDISLRISKEAERFNEQKQEAIGYLSAGLAHDFNNLLTAILGNISLAIDDLPPDSDTARLLKDAEDSTLKGKSLTDQLLTFAKGSPPEKASSETRTSLIRTIDTLLSGSTIKAEYQIEEDLPYVDIAQDAFNTIISNLVMNAMQAMNNHGHLVVRAQVLNKIRDNDLPLKQGKYICIHLIDNGEGITPENQSRIFVPYFSTHPGRSGMGLPNVFAILKRYNGYIRVNSQLGSGTDVEFFIPATNTPIPALEIPAAIQQTGKQNVVILKDEDMLRNLLVKTMEKMDLCVQTTADPDEMIELCDKARTGGNPVSMVIIDFNVPNVPDFQMYVNKLKAAIPAPKLIASRSYINPEEVSAYHEMGFDDILSKPFHIAELKSIVNRSLNF